MLLLSSVRTPTGTGPRERACWSLAISPHWLLQPPGPMPQRCRQPHWACGPLWAACLGFCHTPPALLSGGWRAAGPEPYHLPLLPQPGGVFPGCLIIPCFSCIQGRPRSPFSPIHACSLKDLNFWENPKYERPTDTSCFKL